MAISEIDGYFDEVTEFLDGISPVPVQSLKLAFQCKTSDVPKDTIQGTAINITRDDGSVFSGEVVTNEPDGFGLTLLQLRDNE